MKNTTFLITGGCGFIGSALVRYLIKETDAKVVNVDKLTYAGNIETLSDVSQSSRYKFANIDICDFVALKSLFDKYEPDVVIHLAAESHVDKSIEGPDEFINTNIIGTYRLLESTRYFWSKLSGDKKEKFRFLHVSTDEVYGDLPHPDNSSSDSLPKFEESTAYSPSSPYSASKASSDHLVMSWFKTYGLPVLITNCSNNYGPFQFPEKLIPQTMLRALRGLEIPIYGNGRQIRDWLHVEDHVRALLLVAEQGSVGSSYNVGGDNEKTNIEVVHKICEILQEINPSPHGFGYKDLIAHVKDRPGHDMRYSINAEKIDNELGWKPQETFESGLRKTVYWFISNIDYYSRIEDGSYKENNHSNFGDI